MLLTPDSRTDLPETIRSTIGREPLDWLGVPLVSSKGILGALVVQSYSGDVRYTEKDKALLQFVSTQVAAAIERKQTEARLQYIALHDQLTTLPNRDLLNDRQHTAIALARREREQLAVLYIDLDHFKQVNDSLGHEVGNQLLREAARRLTGSVRGSDTVGRIGGDEFVVLLHGIERPEHAVAVAEKSSATWILHSSFPARNLRCPAALASRSTRTRGQRPTADAACRRCHVCREATGRKTDRAGNATALIRKAARRAISRWQRQGV